MSKPKIPRGWVELEPNTPLVKGDKFWSALERWSPATMVFGTAGPFTTYIRKRNPATGTGAQGKGAGQ